MARGATSLGNTLSVAAAAATVYPISMSAWFKPNSDNAADRVVNICQNFTTGNYLSLAWAGDLGANPVVAIAYNGTTTNYAASTTAFGIGLWIHGCAVFSSATLRAVYKNGIDKGTDTNDNTPTNLANMGIGRGPSAAGAKFMNGSVAEVGIWNVALTDADAMALARGFSPLLVRPEGLVAYWPLIGRYSPEIDLRNGYNLTVAGTVGVVNHCRILRP